MKDEDSRKQVEKGLGSIGRLRILRVLASGKAPSYTRYSLERATGLKPIDVRKHLKILSISGWVKEHEFNPPTYTLNPDNVKIKILVEFFEKIGYL